MGRLWLAYGITSVRNPAGIPYGSSEDIEAVEAGTRVGPRIFTMGSALDGARIYYSASLPMDVGSDLEMELDRARRLDYDGIKTYVRYPDVVQKRVIEYAHRHGIPVTSHYLFPAVAVGSDGVKHMSGSTSALGNSYRDVIELLGRSKMQVTPTIVSGVFAIKLMRDPSLLADPRFTALLPSWDVNATRASVEHAASATDLNISEARQERVGRTLLAIVRAGGKVVAGTDSPHIPYAVTLILELERFNN